jgi:hypothetical protein
MFNAGFFTCGLRHGCRRQSLKGVVRGAGLEPAQYCYRQDLNLVRLPISPPARLKNHSGNAENKLQPLPLQIG